ncbi:hypothetical protein ACFL36_01285 [Thermodesulfobacteriota bacterium]
MKISIFDFKKKWQLVEPHLNDPEVTELLDQGMLNYSLRQDRWVHLPLWDAENGHGPWKYTKTDAHHTNADERFYEDPDFYKLEEKYNRIIEKMGVNLDDMGMCLGEFLFPPKDSKLKKIGDAYTKERDKIFRKYLPQKNTYQWYQCFGAADYLSAWSKKLAEKVLPEFTWKTYRKYNKQSTNPVFNFTEYIGCTTTIGWNEKGNFLIFDIVLFDSESVDGILKAVGLNRKKLQNELNKIIKKQLMKISSEIRILAKQTEKIAVEIGKIEAKENKSKTTKTAKNSFK